MASITADQLRCSQPFDIIDEHPLNGINYYRLKVIDPDNKFIISNTLSFEIKTKEFEILTISPNPVLKEDALLKINSRKKSQINIRISDLAGRLISNQSVALNKGVNLVVLKTQSLAKGTYQVTAFSSGVLPKTISLIKR